MLTKTLPKTITSQISHLYGTQSETKVNSITLQSPYKDEESYGVISNLFNHVATKLWW